MTSQIPSIIAAFALVAVPTVAQASPPKRSSGAMVGTSGTASLMQNVHDSKSDDKDRFRDKDRDEHHDCDADDHKNKCHKKPPSPR